MARNLLKAILQAERRTPGRINTREVIEKIESGYLADSRNGYKQKKTFSPSSIAWGSGKCPRYWYLAFHGADFQDTVTPQQVANMRNGSLAHERIQNAIKDSGILLSKEKKMLNDDPPIFGYEDGEILWDKAPVPIEIKTTNDMSFARRKETSTALEYHIEQLLIYMRIDDRDMGLIIYENKNTHELLVVPVEMDDNRKAWVDDAFQWMRDVKSASDNNLLPKRNYRSNSKVCKSCPLESTCITFPNEGDIALPSLVPLS